MPTQFGPMDSIRHYLRTPDRTQGRMYEQNITFAGVKTKILKAICTKPGKYNHAKCKNPTVIRSKGRLKHKFETLKLRYVQGKKLSIFEITGKNIYIYI
jgi:hypothetical protein